MKVPREKFWGSSWGGRAREAVTETNPARVFRLRGGLNLIFSG